MILLVSHILIALVSIGYTTYLFFKPLQNRFIAAYLLAGATLVSGTVLVLSRGSHLMESCAVGLVYLAAVCVAIYSAKNKLAYNLQSTDRG